MKTNKYVTQQHTTATEIQVLVLLVMFFYFTFQILLVCLLCIPCVAIVENVTCSTSDPSNCTTYGEAECDGNTCLCKTNHYDDELTCQLSKCLK